MVKDKTSGEPDPEAAEKVVNGMRERNILIGIAGRHGNVLKNPPTALLYSRACRHFPRRVQSGVGRRILKAFFATVQQEP